MDIRSPASLDLKHSDFLSCFWCWC